MDIVGKSIGRYEIQEHIGEGGMAEVYKAFDPEINRTVALKVLKEEHCKNEEHKNRFLKEGKAAGALTHPNIVTIYDVGSIEDSPYIMMEFLQGDTLHDILQKGEKLPLEEILEAASHLAGALDYAHSRGVVHRDMKPDNIMMGEDGKSAKIADFGIARMEDPSGKESTQVGMMLGTPRYMSPEQACGATVDGRSDLFALGVIMYEMITGKKAFDAESMPTLIMQIVQKDPVPIRQITADAPVGLQKIVKKLLQKKPEKRFQTGRELQVALQREVRNLREAKEEQPGYLPLHIKWTAIMSAVVALAMALSSLLVLKAQREALTQQAIDSGLSLTKFIAVQAAIPVLGEDWIGLESLVQDAAARDTFSYLIVSDHKGVVRSASEVALIGQEWQVSGVKATLLKNDEVEVTDLHGTFNFDVPVLFNETRVGGVNLGLATRNLDAALGTTSRMMIFLAFAIVLAVSLVAYMFNKGITRNLLVATRALQLFGQNQLEVRISKWRTDEFGDLYAAFNGMADKVERVVDTEAKSSDDDDSRPEAIEPDISGITNRMVNDRTVVLESHGDNDG